MTIKYKNPKIYFFFLITFGIVFGICSFSVMADINYPAKPITLVVPFAAGGSTDIATRGIVTHVNKYLKVSLIIKNMPGADGTIGYNNVYGAKPDGYTLLSAPTLPMILSELSRETKFKSLEFKPIFAFVRDTLILVVNPDFCKSFDEFVKIATASTIRIGTTGGATSSGLGGIILVEKLGLKANWIPFGGGAESLTALAGKHIDAVMTITASAFSLIKAGKIRPLVIFTDKRHPKFSDVPVSRELGIDIPLLTNHIGILAPPQTSEERIKIVEEAFARAVEDKEYLEWLNKVATAELVPLSSKEYKKEIERLFTVAEKYKKYLK
jgi:tripartite-type tricarboxylate transporter receptor subunit TctC